ncbi:toprim domain-containing protein [Candidatus Methylobacter favarea]|nr:toprim domain-containing protein [Candidatus Methylobacter favarea]
MKNITILIFDYTLVVWIVNLFAQIMDFPMTNLAPSLYGDALNEFRDTLNDTLGACLSCIEHDGKIHRFMIDGKLTGAYRVHLDGHPAGYFQCFRQDIKQNWKYSGSRQTYSEADKQVFKLRLVEQEKQRQKEIALLQSQAATRSQTIWGKSLPTPDNYPYLVRKNIQPHNSRLYKEALAIPIFDKDKTLVNLQFINEDGIKRFLKGGKLHGCFSVIGQTSDEPMDITEGWATGVSVYERHGHQTFIAFSANSLEPVARALRDLFPMRRLYIYGDNDINGVGQEAAHKAAISSKGVAVIPDIPGTDWNDIYSINSNKEVSQ